MRLVAEILLVGAAAMIMQAPATGQSNNQELAGEERLGRPLRAHDVPVLVRQEQVVREYLLNHPEVAASLRVKKTSLWNFQVGSAKSWYADDLTNGSRYQVPSTCRAVGTNCYVFVEDASWSAGKVTQAGVDSVVKAFDQKTPMDAAKGIYQIDVETFGNSPDVDGDSRIIILILDIRDGYVPGGKFVVGYFYSFNEFPTSIPGFSTSNVAEMFFLDCDPLSLSTTTGLQEGLSTLAHEFQHTIHFNYDISEITFMNESCSTLAEVVCGYPIYWQSGYVNETNISLFSWRSLSDANVLRDYSRAARFSVYLRDQFGAGLFRPLVASTLHGSDGIDAALAAIGTARRFNDVFVDWCIANRLDDASVNPRYAYTYPGLAKAVGRTFPSPAVPLTADTVQHLGVRYLSFTGGTDLRAQFTRSNPSIQVYAIEIGTSAKRVLDVQPGVEFSEPAFGTTYQAVHFAVVNRGNSVPFAYSYLATGQQTALELKYDEAEPIGVLTQSAGDTVVVQFDGVPGARLDSVRVALRRAGSMPGGVWRYTGVLRPSPLGAPLAVPITASIATTPASPYPVPWPNWSTVDIRSYKIDASTSFVVGFVNQGTYIPETRVMVTSYPGTTPYHSYSWLNAPSSGTPNWYYLTKDAGNVWIYLIRAYVSFGPLDAREPRELLPVAFSLDQNYPNPFNPSTTIAFELPVAGGVSLTVFDLLGREIAMLYRGDLPAGAHSLQWDGKNEGGLGVGSGVYIYRLEANGFVQSRKMTLVK